MVRFWFRIALPQGHLDRSRSRESREGAERVVIPAKDQEILDSFHVASDVFGNIVADLYVFSQLVKVFDRHGHRSLMRGVNLDE